LGTGGGCRPVRSGSSVGGASQVHASVPCRPSLAASVGALLAGGTACSPCVVGKVESLSEGISPPPRGTCPRQRVLGGLGRLRGIGCGSRGGTLDSAIFARGGFTPGGRMPAARRAGRGDAVGFSSPTVRGLVPRRHLPGAAFVLNRSSGRTRFWAEGGSDAAAPWLLAADVVVDSFSGSAVRWEEGWRPPRGTQNTESRERAR